MTVTGPLFLMDIVQRALPIEYGIRINIMATEQEQTKEIMKQLQNLYTEEVQIKVPDTANEGEFCSIRLAINPDVSDCQ